MTGNRKHSFDYSYFDNIDSEKKAYFLGLLYADGNNITSKSTEGISISLQKEDGYILEILKKDIKSDYPLIKRDKTNNRSEQIMFYVYYKGLKEKLDKIGLYQRKTCLLDFPLFLDDNMMHHFIRGYFDGDGCVWNGKRKKMLVKDGKSKNGYRYRIVHNVKFNITGYTGFIKNLQNWLNEKIGLPFNKFNYRHKTNLACATIEYSGRGNIEKFYNYIYNGANVYLKRKKNKFCEILKINDL